MFFLSSFLGYILINGGLWDDFAWKHGCKKSGRVSRYTRVLGESQGSRRERMILLGNMDVKRVAECHGTHGFKVLGDRTGGLQGGAHSGTHGGSGDSGCHGGAGCSGGHGGARSLGCLHGGAGSLGCLRGRAGSLGGHGW